MPSARSTRPSVAKRTRPMGSASPSVARSAVSVVSWVSRPSARSWSFSAAVTRDGPSGVVPERLCGLPQVIGRAPRAPRLDDECDDQHHHRHDEHELEPHGLSIACQPT